MLRRQLSPGPAVPRLRFRGPNVHVPLWLLALGWALNRTLAAVVWLILHPRSALALATLVVAWAVWLRWGWAPYGWGCSAAAVVLGTWWARWPDGFQRHVSDRAQGWWRRFVYWRDWQPAMVTAGLSLAPALGASLPRLRSVATDGSTDRVRVRMLPGQTLEQWQAAAPKLATTWQLRAVRVRRVPNRPQYLELIARRRAVPAADIPQVTEPPVAVDSELEAPRPGAFPRAPRRAS